MATNRNITDLQTLSKTSVDSKHYLETSNSTTKVPNKLSVASLFPTFSTSGTSSEDLYVSVTNKNQLNFKGIKSGDADLLTVTTASNNIVLTALEAGIDLSLCNNATSGFVTGVDFTGLITGECGVPNGGTGLSTIAKGAMLYASATDTIAATSAMSTNGQILIGNATTGIPTLNTITGGAGVTVDNSVAGAITLTATIANAEANIDLRNLAGSTTYNIDTHGGDGWLSGDGNDGGITVDADDKVYIGANGTKVFSEILTLAGNLRFTGAATVKPTAATGGDSGATLTIEGGSSASGSAGNLELKAGTAASGGGNGGHTLIYGGSESGGDAGSIKNYVYNGSGGAVEALSVAGNSAEPNVTVGKGNLVVTEALKGIVHTGMLTATQSAGALTNAVTINSTSGIITLSATGLAAANNAEFTFTNSTIQADSVILLTMQDANTTNNAQLTCALVSVHGSGGSCVISIHNPASTGTTSSTASKIHFLVINNS